MALLSDVERFPADIPGAELQYINALFLTENGKLLLRERGML